jgi:succinyl-diaminopimelate desuccinylase
MDTQLLDKPRNTKRMTNNRHIEKIKELVAIESTAQNSKGLREAHDFMVNLLRASGKDIVIEKFESGGRPSFLAYKGPKRPEQFHLILNGHVDVVPGKSKQYEAFVRNGKLYGRGVHDMKAACIVMAEVFCEFVDKVPFALGLQIVTDEENAGQHGTLRQVQQGVRSDFVICGECGRTPDVYEIANRAKGIIVVEIGFNGKSAHGAYPWNGDNAAAQAYRFVHALHERHPVPTGPTEESTVTITSFVAASDAHTKTPESAVVKLDIRYVPGDPDFSDLPKFKAFIKALDPNAEIQKFYDFSSPLYTDPNDLQLLSLKTAAEAVEGHRFRLVQRNATSDGRFYGDVGNQACEFGIAGEYQHGDGEYITLESLNNYHRTLRLFLRNEKQRAVLEQEKNKALEQTAVL